MTEPRTNVEIVKRPTDRLVEAIDVFAVRGLPIVAIPPGILSENHRRRALMCGTTLALCFD